LQAGQKRPLSDDLCTQLNILARFQKQLAALGVVPEHLPTSINFEALEALDQIPQVMTFVSKLVEFKSSAEDKYVANAQDNTPDSIPA
jgi:hypothetical protein